MPGSRAQRNAQKRLLGEVKAMEVTPASRARVNAVLQAKAMRANLENEIKRVGATIPETEILKEANRTRYQGTHGSPEYSSIRQLDLGQINRVRSALARAKVLAIIEGMEK